MAGEAVVAGDLAGVLAAKRNDYTRVAIVTESPDETTYKGIHPVLVACAQAGITNLDLVGVPMELEGRPGSEVPDEAKAAARGWPMSRFPDDRLREEKDLELVDRLFDATGMGMAIRLDCTEGASARWLSSVLKRFRRKGIERFRFCLLLYNEPWIEPHVMAPTTRKLYHVSCTAGRSIYRFVYVVDCAGVERSVRERMVSQVVTGLSKVDWAQKFHVLSLKEDGIREGPSRCLGWPTEARKKQAEHLLMSGRDGNTSRLAPALLRAAERLDKHERRTPLIYVLSGGNFVDGEEAVAVAQRLRKEYNVYINTYHYGPGRPETEAVLRKIAAVTEARYRRVDVDEQGATPKP